MIRSMNKSLRGRRLERFNLPALALTVALSGCLVHTMASRMDQWVGKDEALLVERWGAPNLTAPLPNGGKTLTWVYTVTDDDHSLRQCRRSMTISPAGKVLSWSSDQCNPFGAVKTP